MREKKTIADLPKGKVNWSGSNRLIVHQDDLHPLDISLRICIRTNYESEEFYKVKSLLYDYDSISDADKLITLSKIYIDICDCHMDVSDNLDATITFKLKDNVDKGVRDFYEKLNLFDQYDAQEVYNFLYNKFIELRDIQDSDILHKEEYAKDVVQLHMISCLKMYSQLVENNDFLKESNSFRNV